MKCVIRQKRDTVKHIYIDTNIISISYKFRQWWYSSTSIGKGATTVLKLGGGPSAQGASRVEAPKAPRGVGRGEKVSPSPLGDGTEEGAVRKFFDHLSENGEFWCILGGASALYVATAQERRCDIAWLWRCL